MVRWYYFCEEQAMPTTVTSKGQVTIPKRVREHLGIVPGSQVEFDPRPDGSVMLVHKKTKGNPRRSLRSRFTALRGSVKLSMTTDEIMALTRGED
jgi:antitoxin PrlF